MSNSKAKPEWVRCGYRKCNHLASEYRMQVYDVPNDTYYCDEQHQEKEMQERDADV